AYSIVVDDVILNQRSRNQPASSLREVSVHVQTYRIVVMQAIASNGGVVAAVRDIDAMLGLAGIAFVVLKEGVVGEVGKDAPGGIVAIDPVFDGDVGAVVYANGGSVGIEGA